MLFISIRRCFMIAFIILTMFANADSWSFPPKSSLRVIRQKRRAHFVTSEANAPVLSTACDPIASVSPIVPADESILSRNPYKRFIKPLVKVCFKLKEKSAFHDSALEKNGGVWQSQSPSLGKVMYATSSHLPNILRQLAQAEARGHLQNSWPKIIIDILGHDSLVAAADVQTDDSYFKARTTLVDALSTQNILKRSIPGIQRELKKVSAHWDEVSSLPGNEHNQNITVFADDVNDITYNIIINSIFGSDSMTPDDMRILRKCTSAIGKGMAGIPIDIPIFNRLPLFRRYRRAIRARKVMRKLVAEKVAQKRHRLSQCTEDPKVMRESSGILDDFILQMGASSVSSSSGWTEEKLINFCVDNTILAIFAGFDTTTSLMTNIVLLLHEDPDAVETIRKELESFDIFSIPRGQLEVLDSLPALKSTMLEANRLHPTIPITYRQTTSPVQVGNVIIPSNTIVQLNYVYGSLSQSLYDNPEKACPLRFLKQNNVNSHDDRNGKELSEISTPQMVTEEALPNVFGYGKHLCPGQYLAQIEIALVLKELLCNFDFELVEGQNLRPTLPFNIPKSGLQMRLTSRIGSL